LYWHVEIVLKILHYPGSIIAYRCVYIEITGREIGKSASPTVTHHANATAHINVF
jgi:hypothetical protein